MPDNIEFSMCTALIQVRSLSEIFYPEKTYKIIRSRCQILIDLEESHGDSLTHGQSAKDDDVCLSTVANTVTKHMSGGIEAVTEYERSINSDNAGRKVDRHAETRIIEFAYVSVLRDMPAERSACWKKNPVLCWKHLSTGAKKAA